MPTVLRLGNMQNFDSPSLSDLRQSRLDVDDISYSSLVDTKQTKKDARKFDRFRSVQKEEVVLPIISTEQYEVNKKKSGSIAQRGNVLDPHLNWTRHPR